MECHRGAILIGVALIETHVAKILVEKTQTHRRPAVYCFQLSKQLRRLGLKAGDGPIHLCCHPDGKSPRRGHDHCRDTVRRQRMTVEPALAQLAAKPKED